MNTGVILQENIPYVWDRVKPLLQLAVDEAKGELTIEQVYNKLMDGTQMLYVCAEGETVVAALTMEILQFPNKKVISVCQAGGTRMEEWYRPMAEQAEKLARIEKAQTIYVTGRRGWVRQLKNVGYEEYFTIVGKEVDL